MTNIIVVMISELHLINESLAVLNTNKFVLTSLLLYSQFLIVECLEMRF